VKQGLVQGLIRTGELWAFQVGGRGLLRIGRQDVENYIQHAYRRTAGWQYPYFACGVSERRSRLTSMPMVGHQLSGLLPRKVDVSVTYSIGFDCGVPDGDDDASAILSKWVAGVSP
jgi:hypothetical protein